jgi:hypothetical protein
MSFFKQTDGYNTPTDRGFTNINDLKSTSVKKFENFLEKTKKSENN